jgi:hypothetical protein
VVAVYGAGLLSWALYNGAPASVANTVIVVYAACLLVGPSLVYAVLRRGGSRMRHAAAAGLGLPLLWLFKELVRVTAVHPFLESLYYALNPVSVGVFSAALVPMALVEVERRRREGRLHLEGWPGIVLGVFVLLAVTAAVVGYDNGGREIFYAYVALYRILFVGGP